MTNLKKISIDGIEVEVDGAMTIIQAAEVAGVEIPRFCYHERLTIAGNCRMCLVEVQGGPPKPAASCAMQVRDLRPGPNGEAPVVKTRSPMATPHACWRRFCALMQRWTRCKKPPRRWRVRCVTKATPCTAWCCRRRRLAPL